MLDRVPHLPPVVRAELLSAVRLALRDDSAVAGAVPDDVVLMFLAGSLREGLELGDQEHLPAGLRTRLVEIARRYSLGGELDLDSDTQIDDFDFVGDARICLAIARRLAADAQAVEAEHVHEDRVAELGHRLLVLPAQQRAWIIRQALRLGARAEDRKVDDGTLTSETDDLVAGRPVRDFVRENGQSRRQFAAWVVCSQVAAAASRGWFNGRAAAPVGVIRAASPVLGEILSWAVMNAEVPVAAATDDVRGPVRARAGVQVDPGRANVPFAFTNPRSRARWARACRVVATLASCAAGQLVAADGQVPDLSRDDELVVRRDREVPE